MKVIPPCSAGTVRQPCIHEVWIISGWGIVRAATEMIHYLRDSHLPVRIPNLVLYRLPYAASSLPDPLIPESTERR